MAGRFDPIAYLSIAFLSFLFFLIALVTNNWGLVRGSNEAAASCGGVNCGTTFPDGVRANYGLWKAQLKYSPSNYDSWDYVSQDCSVSLPVFTSGTGSTVDLTNIHLPGDGSDCAKFNAVRAMIFLAMFFSLFALILQAVVAAREHPSAGLASASAFCSLFAAVCGMIGMAIYINIARNMPDNIQSTPQDYGFSFWCNAIGAWPISLFAALSFLLGVQPDEHTHKAVVPQ